MADHAKIAGWTECVLRAAVTAVYLWAGVVKVIAPATFHRDIAGYRLVSSDIALVVAAYLPWLEIIAAIGLWVRPLTRGAIQILLALTCLFLVAIVTAWARGLDIACGCFGATGGATNYLLLVGRDLALIVALGAVFVLRGRGENRG